MFRACAKQVVEEGKSENEDGFVTTYIFSPVICCPSEVGIIDKIRKPLPGGAQCRVAPVPAGHKCGD